MSVFELKVMWKKYYLKSKARVDTHIHMSTHAALDSGTNGPQRVVYKGGDVMSVMEAVSLYQWSISYPAVLCAT